MTKSTGMMKCDVFPAGFESREVVRTRWGSLSFASREKPAVFWIVAEGFITPGLIRDEFSLLQPFASAHPEGWDYVVDTTRVRMIHPWNPMLLRKVRKLPNNRRYVIYAPPLIRIFGFFVAWLIRPTHIVGTLEEALLVVAQDS